MREIKLRAWDKTRKCFIDVPDLKDLLFSYGCNYDYTNGNDVEISQFTGLKDKNGTPIYEGDIIQFTYWWFDGGEAESDLKGTIVYSDHNMSFQLKGVKNKDWERHTGYKNDCDYLTPFSELNFDEADFLVIGNIYQNPELLND